MAHQRHGKNMRVKIRELMRLSRIEHGIMVLIAVIIAGWVYKVSVFSTFQKADVIKLVLGGLAGLFVEIATFTLNDYFNIEEDKINAPTRPLVTGTVSPKEAVALAIVSAIAAGLISLYICLNYGLYIQLITIVAALALGLLYDIKLKKVLLVGNTIVALLTALPFIYGAFLIENSLRSSKNVLFFTIAFIATLGREFVKGIIDVEGDKIAGVSTLATKYGAEVATACASIMFIMAVILTIPLTLTALSSRFFFLYIALIALTDLVFLYAVYLPYFKRDRREIKDIAKYIRKITLFGMLLGIISFSLTV